VRVRPGRSSRPRTRTRPKHDDAVDGFVSAVDRGRYTVEVGGDAPVTAMRARELGRKSVVVGDRVALVGDTSGAAGALARIVRIAERVSVLRRTADDDDTTPEGRLERVVVANADQLVIVSSLSDPPPRTGFIDRCLVAAYDADIDPLLCLTKADLAGPAVVLD
jgi:ribosome biogenesis GTPase / thiamine phosphate phosphatase